MLWPFAPHDSFVEGMEFRSDVLRAFAEEQRIQLRGIPWRRFNHNYAMTAREYERARNMMRGVHPGPFDVPDWSDFRVVDAGPGDSALAFDNTSPQLTSAHDVIIWQDSSTYETLSIGASTTAGLTLSVPLTKDYPQGRILRVLECETAEGLAAQKPAGYERAASVEWVCYDDTVPTEDTSELGTYRTEYLLDDCPQVGGDALPETTRHAFNAVDNGIGRPFVDTSLEQADEIMGLVWQPSTRAEAWALRRKLMALRGRQKAFWMPSYNRGGLELAANAANGAGSLTIFDAELETGYGDDTDVYFLLTDGTVITRQVTAITPGVGTEVLTLSGTMPRAVTNDDIVMFCTLNRMRLEQDRIEWNHRPAVGPMVVVAASNAPLPE